MSPDPLDIGATLDEMYPLLGVAKQVAETPPTEDQQLRAFGLNRKQRRLFARRKRKEISI